VGGAIAGWLAMITPAFLIIPLVYFAGQKAENSNVKEVIKSIMIASSAMLFMEAIPLAQNAIFDTLTALIALGSFIVLMLDLIPVHWLMLLGVGLTLGQYLWIN
jgi:chromate transporter